MTPRRRMLDKVGVKRDFKVCEGPQEARPESAVMTVNFDRHAIGKQPVTTSRLPVRK